MGRVTFPLNSYPTAGMDDPIIDRAAALTKAAQVGIADGTLVLNLITNRLHSDGLTAEAIALVPRPLQDDVLVIVEGDGLPVYTRGNYPWACDSYSNLVNAWADKVSPFWSGKAGG